MDGRGALSGKENAIGKKKRMCQGSEAKSKGKKCPATKPTKRASFRISNPYYNTVSLYAIL